VRLWSAKGCGYVGINLTVPHKLSLALKMVDVLDESASTWAPVTPSASTGLDEQGQWLPLVSLVIPRAKSVRTDSIPEADALSRALREDLRAGVVQAKRPAPWARWRRPTAALRLAAEKVSELFLVNRTRSKAEALAGKSMRAIQQ